MHAIRRATCSPRLPIFLHVIFVCVFVKCCALYLVLKLFFTRKLVAFSVVVLRVPRILDFTVYLLVFLRAKTNCRIALTSGIPLMNSNCFAICFQQHSSYVCSDIYTINAGKRVKKKNYSVKTIFILQIITLILSGFKDETKELNSDTV